MHHLFIHSHPAIAATLMNKCLFSLSHFYQNLRQCSIYSKSKFTFKSCIFNYCFCPYYVISTNMSSDKKKTNLRSPPLSLYTHTPIHTYIHVWTNFIKKTMYVWTNVAFLWWACWVHKMCHMNTKGTRHVIVLYVLWWTNEPWYWLVRVVAITLTITWQHVQFSYCSQVGRP